MDIYSAGSEPSKYYCLPNQSIMNTIEPQFQTIITVAQTSQFMNIIEPPFQTNNTVPNLANYE